jgi:hypothetical protein
MTEENQETEYQEAQHSVEKEPQEEIQTPGPCATCVAVGIPCRC